MGARINGTELEWRDRGAGDAVLLIHGFPLNSAMWGAQLTALSGACRVVAPDLRGFGASDPGNEPAFGMDLLARDLAALLDHLGIERAVVCGLSMGGYVALEFFRQFRNRVRALVLCDTRAGPDSAETQRARGTLAERVLAENTTRPVVEGLLPRLVCVHTARKNPGIVAMVRAMMQEGQPDSVARMLHGMATRVDSEPLLRDIDVPTLIIVGSDDVITNRGQAEMLARGIRGARLEVVSASGHLPPVEQPDEFNQILSQFLEGLPTEAEAASQVAY
ncbi:MAG: alpha/beta fold hydrolase [Gemmatimonadota bacterium]|jgi:pimeloyl-ACP methyl ester carboxylesterase